MSTKQFRTQVRVDIIGILLAALRRMPDPNLHVLADVIQDELDKTTRTDKDAR